MLYPERLRAGYEQHEEYYSPVMRDYRVQYDYRHTDGELFSTIGKSLEDCREKRDLWLKKHLEEAAV